MSRFLAINIEGKIGQLIVRRTSSVTCGRSVVFSGTPFSSTNKNDRNDIIEILLKVASLNTINVNPNRVPCWGILHVSHIRTIDYLCKGSPIYSSHSLHGEVQHGGIYNYIS